MMRTWRLSLLTCCLAALMACHEQRPDVAAPPAAPAAQAAPSAPTPPAEDAAAVAPAPTAQEGCAAHLSKTPESTFQLGKWTATRAGTSLTLTRGDAAKAESPLVLGVLGPINEDTGPNLVALQKYLAFFRKERADAIVVTGDAGETAAGLSHVLETLATSKLPVFVVIGNSECAQDYTEGVQRAQRGSSNIVNLNDLRSVAFPQATLVSLPGYHDPNYMHCAKGCLYGPTAIPEVIQAASEAKSPVILVSHGPPRGSGKDAVDYATNGGNVGNPDITRAIEQAKIPYGFFSNIKEGGARATDASGTTLIPQRTLAQRLYLNPGPASTDAWTMNDGKTSHGFAATFTVDAKGAKWNLLRNTPLSAAEKKEAHALESAHENTP